MPSFLLVTLLLHYSVTFNISWLIELVNHLLDSKMTITLELKLCVCQILAGE